MRIIPAIDIMDGQVVRLLRGNPDEKTVYGKDPITMAKKWADEGADLIHVVDLDAALGRGSNKNVIKQIAGAVNIPVQAAGGLRTDDAVGEALKSASRVVIGTMAFVEGTAARLAGRYGADRIIISADHIDGRIVVDGWRKDAGAGLLEGIRHFASKGIREFLLTSVRTDGAMCGPDLDWLSRACSIPDIRIIASGGISGKDDIVPVRKTGASGVILGRALYEKKITIAEARAA